MEALKLVRASLKPKGKTVEVGLFVKYGVKYAECISIFGLFDMITTLHYEKEPLHMYHLKKKTISHLLFLIYFLELAIELHPYGMQSSFFPCKIFIICTNTLFGGWYLICNIKVTTLVDSTMIADINVSQEHPGFRNP